MRITRSKCPDTFLCYLKDTDNTRNDYYKRIYIKHHIPLVVKKIDNGYYADIGFIAHLYCNDEDRRMYGENVYKDDVHYLHNLTDKALITQPEYPDSTCIAMSDIEELIPLENIKEHL